MHPADAPPGGSGYRGRMLGVKVILSAPGFRSQIRATFTGTGPIPVITSRSDRRPWRTSRARPSSSFSPEKAAIGAANSTWIACSISLPAPSRRTTVNGSEPNPPFGRKLTTLRHRHDMPPPQGITSVRAFLFHPPKTLRAPSYTITADTAKPPRPAARHRSLARRPGIGGRRCAHTKGGHKTMKSSCKTYVGLLVLSAMIGAAGAGTDAD